MTPDDDLHSGIRDAVEFGVEYVKIRLHTAIAIRATLASSDLLIAAVANFMENWDEYRMECLVARVWAGADEAMHQAAEPVRAALREP